METPKPCAKYPEMAATDTLSCAAADPNDTASIVPARHKLLSALFMSFPFSFFQLLKPRLDHPRYRRDGGYFR
jgi:hypothetical protein